VALPLLGRYARLHKGLDARHQLSAGRSYGFRLIDSGEIPLGERSS